MTTTVGRKSKLGLLFKDYYQQEIEGVDKSGILDMDKLSKLPTRSLMAKAVESLRSFKEAESELRLLLYNNCDKLLDAVHVVVTIRAGSDALLAQSTRAGETKIIRTQPHYSVYAETLKELNRVERIEKFCIEYPKKLLSETICPLSLLKEYLIIRSEFFAPLAEKYVLVKRVAAETAATVDRVVVPKLVAGNDNSSNMAFAMLMELYPESHPEHQRIVGQYIELQLGQLVETIRVARSAAVSPEKALATFRSVLTTWFADNASGGSAGSTILEVLLPEASAQFVSSLFNVETSVSIIEEAATAHLRIPGLAATYLARFRRACWLRWADGLFARAASDDDAMHTRACQVLVRIRNEDTVELNSADLVACISTYYHKCLACTPQLDGSSLIASLSLHRKMQSRGTIMRTLAALRELFELEEAHEDDSKLGMEILAFNDRKIVQFLASWIGSDFARLSETVSQIEPLLDRRGQTVDRFGHRRASTADLELVETVHARKLLFSSGVLTLEQAVLSLVCFFCRSMKVDADEKIIHDEIESVKSLAKTYLSTSEMATVLAMLKDLHVLEAGQ